MKVKELIEKLKEFDLNKEVIKGVYNGFTTTYGVVDHLLQFNPWNDLFGTPGKTDRRLPDEECVYIASEFPYKHGIGSEDINIPIEEINGPNGDPDLIWKLNHFEWLPKIDTWSKRLNPQQSISYFPKGKRLTINNWIDNRHFNMIAPGIEDLRNGIRLCNLNLTIMS